MVLIFWLKPCFDLWIQTFDFLNFANFVFLRFSCCFAWYLASHTHSSISPNTIVPSLPSPPDPPSIATPHSLPDSSSPPTAAAAPTPEQTAVSDRRGAWEVQPTRQANSSYLTSHLAADRHGGSVQVHTPHLIEQQPFTQPLWSQICLMRFKSARTTGLILASPYFPFRSSFILLFFSCIYNNDMNSCCFLGIKTNLAAKLKCCWLLGLNYETDLHPRSSLPLAGRCSFSAPPRACHLEAPIPDGPTGVQLSEQLS